MAPPDYAELHCLTNFTFLRGASHPEELAARAAERGYTALAVTDECSLAGVVRAHQAAKEAGLHLIVGSEVRLEDGLKLVLLATDREGYGNLSRLITRGRRRAEKGAYRLTREDLAEGLPGCLVLWVPDVSVGRASARQPADAEAAETNAVPRRPEGRPTGEIREGKIRDARDATPSNPESRASNLPAADGRWVAETFPGRAWIAVELHLGPDDAGRLRWLRDLGEATGLPLVAAGDVHMHRRGRRALQDMLTAVRLNTTVAKAGEALYPNGERHLRPRTRLARLYPSELLAETVRIAARCRFNLDELRYNYPDEAVPTGETPASHLRRLTEEGLRRCWPEGEPARVRQLVEHELKVIAELEYEPYFLTVHDIVRFARGRGILCQGRGSAANSAVCYCLGITAVDPSRMEMLFERFVSKERDEPPDIDVDFEHTRREEVIQYIYERYGRGHAAIAATVITYRNKGALRDAGRAMGLSEDSIQRLTGAFSLWDRKGDLTERVREAGFDPENPTLRRVLTLAAELRGFPRHLSQHVGGMVITRDPIATLVPVENAAMPTGEAGALGQDGEDGALPAARTVIQWDKDDLEALGMMKVDCLALGMLSAIHKAFDLVARHRGHSLTLDTVPAEDPATYDMISAGDTVGVFQIESRAQMAMLPRLRPRTFYDLVIEVAIIRPGPIQGDMIHPFLRRRQGLEPITYPGPEARAVLERTLGVPIFQEQVIKLAMVAAGFSAGEADRLRRALAAWRRKGTLAQFEDKLREGMAARHYPPEFTEQIIAQLKGFGEYGFPESHAASFALLAYISAWLKRHEPAAFVCALLNSQPMGFYAPAQLVRDAREHGVEVRPVDVMVSEWDCTLEDKPDTDPVGRASARHPAAPEAPRRPEGRPTGDIRDGETRDARGSSNLEPRTSYLSVRLGLRRVRGLKKAAAKRLAAARREAPFTGVEEMARRADLSRSDLERLAAAGALAGIAGNRHQARWRVLGVQEPLPLFDKEGETDASPLLPVPSEGEDLVADYRHVGLTLGRHPLALLRDRLRGLGYAPLDETCRRRDGAFVRAAGLVITRQKPGDGRTTFITIEDESGIGNVIIWERLGERYRKEVFGARLLGIVGRLQSAEGVVHLVARRIIDHTDLLGGLATRSRDFC